MIKNKIICTFLTLLMMVVLLSSCAFMPRTTLEADNVDIIESSIPNSTLKIHVTNLNSQIVEQNNTRAYHYILGVGDQFILYVWGHPEFSSPLGISYVGDKSSAYVDGVNEVNNALSNPSLLSDTRVSSYDIDENGDADIPMIGRIHMAGYSPLQMKQVITDKLKKYVVNPQVSLRVIAFRSQKIYVVGEVNTPKAFYLTDAPYDLSSVLVAAGWVNLATADVKNIYVMRLVDSNNVDVYRLDATSATNLLFASAFSLKANDIVFVSTAGVAQFGRIIPTITNLAQAVWFTTNILPFDFVKVVPTN